MAWQRSSSKVRALNNHLETTKPNCCFIFLSTDQQEPLLLEEPDIVPAKHTKTQMRFKIQGLKHTAGNLRTIYGFLFRNRLLKSPGFNGNSEVKLPKAEVALR
jgi:hypothetical protein